MLKSRRGLLAAGLAVAVVGTIGVASTIAAGADQIPGAPAAETSVAAAPAPAEADDLTPPAKLPWGATPVRIRKGRAGATSRTLRASGFAAAAPDADGSVVPEERYAPKGRSNRKAFLKSETTDIAPTDVAPPAPAPAPSSSTTAPPPDGGSSTVKYLYSIGSQYAETDGVYANLTISKPNLAKSDYHTLTELAVQSADGKQIVEVGWNVDRVVNGDDDPHLFVYHWVNLEESCYNACGFVPYSKNITAGATLTYDVSKKFGIQYANGAWWIAFDSEWIGYFPEQLWNKEDIKFSRSGLVQIFGEVAATSDRPCTQMGNGSLPDSESATKVASVSYLGGPPVVLNMYPSSEAYAVAPVKESVRTFRFGGPTPLLDEKGKPIKDEDGKTKVC